MIANSKTMVRLWAGVTSDFEVCIGRFLSQDGNNFQDFAQVANQFKISIIMNLSIGQGKVKNDYYQVVSRIVLDAARKFWLRPRMLTFDNLRMASTDKYLDMRRRLAAFYLVYFLYEKQPHKGRTKLFLDKDDFNMLEKFVKDLGGWDPKLKMDIRFMLLKLLVGGAVGTQVFSIGYGVENWRRTGLTYQRSELAELGLIERDCQDILAYSSIGREITVDVKNQNLLKREFLKILLTTSIHSNTEFLINQGKDRLDFMLLKNVVPKLRKAMNSIERLAYNPILTLEQLTMDQIIQRRIMSDYRQWLQRSRKRIMEGPKKPKREYVRAGSIWGRKKEVEEGEDEHRQRRERGGFSRNLSVYLHDRPFDYVEVEPTPEQVAEEGASTASNSLVPY